MFNFILPGFNLRPIEMEGARISQMKKIESFLIQRRKMQNILLKKSKIYNEYFKVQQEVEIVVGFLLQLFFRLLLEEKRSKILKT